MNYITLHKSMKIILYEVIYFISQIKMNYKIN